MLSVGLDAKGFSSGLSAAQKDLQSFSATASVTGFRLGAAWAATFGALAAFTLKVGSDFETAFAGIKKTLEGTDEQFAKLEETLISTSLATGVSAIELAKLAQIGGTLGVEVQNIGAFTDTITRLSIAAAQLDPEEAAVGLARLGFIVGETTAPEFEKLANVLAFLGDKLPTTEDRILDFSVRISGMANAAKLSGEEILGLAAGFSSVVGQTERGASAVEKFLSELSGAVADGGPKLQAFAEIADMSMEEFSQSFADTPAQAIQEVITGLGKVSEQGLTPLLQKFDELGIKGVRAVSTFAAVAGAGDVFATAMKAATVDTERLTKLNDELAVQMGTVRAQFDRATSGIQIAGQELFKAFAPALMSILAVINDHVIPALIAFAKSFQNLPEAAKIAIVGIGVLITAGIGLVAVLGQIGSALVSSMALIGKLAPVLMSVGSAATTASGGLGSAAVPLGFMGSSAATATTSVGGLSTALGSVGAAASAVVAPIAAIASGLVVGVGAVELMKNRALELQGTFDNVTEAAVENAGIFATAWEGTKAVVSLAFDVMADNFSKGADFIGEFFDSASGITGFIADFMMFTTPVGLLVQGFEALIGPVGQFVDMLSLAADQLGDEVTKGFEFLLQVLGQFPQITNAVTEGQLKAAEAFHITITAGETYASLNEKLVAAQVALRESTAKSTEVIKNQAETIKTAAVSGEVFLQSILADSKASKEFAEVAKFLGVSVKELTERSAEFTPEVLEQARAMMESAKAADVAKKAAKALSEEHKKLVASFKELTLKDAIAEFDAYQKALAEVIASGGEFTKEGLDKIGKELLAFAEQTGREIGPLGKELMQDFFDNALQTADIGVAAVKRKFAGLTTDLPQIAPQKRPPMAAAELRTGADIFAGFEAEEKAEKLKAIQEAIKEADAETKRFQEDVKALAATFEVLGMDADSGIGKILGGLAAANVAGSKIKSTFLNLSQIKLSDKGLMSSEGMSAGIEFGAAMVQGAATVWSASGTGGISGVIGGAMAGMEIGGQIGAMFGPVGEAWGKALGAAAGAAMGIVRAIFKTESEKIADEVMRDFGVEISEELAKAIEATADELDLGRFEANLLHLGDIIGEAGGIAEFGMQKAADAVGDLQNAIEMGAIPAAEGLAQVGEVFGLMAEEATAAGGLADAALLQIVVRARELGQEVPEIMAFVSEQLAQAAEGVSAIIGQSMDVEGKEGEKIFGGIQVATPEDANAQATIFAAAFFATLETEGLAAAVDVFGPAFAEMKAKFQDFGTSIDFGGVERFFEMAADPKFGPLLEGVQGLKDAMTGLGNAGFLTADTFTAFQQQGSAAFDQLVAAGLTSNEALQQMAPFLQEVINASQTFGFEIDANTQALIDQAEAAGIGFKTDPMQQMVDVLGLIAIQLGVTQEALGGIGGKAVETGERLRTAFGEELPETVGEAMNQLADDTSAAFDSMATGASEASKEFADSTKVASEEATAATTAAAEETKAQWITAATGIETQMTELKDQVALDFQSVVMSTEMAVNSVMSLGETAFGAVAGFNALAQAAGEAASAAGAANAGGGDGGGPHGGQFGLAMTVHEPTSFLAGESGTERVEITPGGGRGGGGGGNGGGVILQIDGKTIGKIIGDLSRTGDVRIHPDAVNSFG